jgi:hypothetical protein
MAGVREEDGGVVRGSAGVAPASSFARITPGLKTALLWVAWLAACGVLGYGVVDTDAGMIIAGVVAAAVSGVMLALRLRE